MVSMNGQQRFVDDAPVREFEYDDGTVVFAADLGVVADASTEVVGDTVIVVADDDQFDLELPGGDARATVRNGVLTVEVETEEVEA